MTLSLEDLSDRLRDVASDVRVGFEEIRRWRESVDTRLKAAEDAEIARKLMDARAAGKAEEAAVAAGAAATAAAYAAQQAAKTASSNPPLFGFNLTWKSAIGAVVSAGVLIGTFIAAVQQGIGR